MIATSGISRTLIPANVGANIWIGDKQIRDLHSLKITQHHSGHDQLELRCYQDQVQQEGTMIFDGAEKLLGQVAEVIILDRNGADGSKRLEHLFVISQVSFDHSARNEGILVLQGYAPTYILDNAPHYESFYRQSLSSIARTVSKPLERLKSKIKADPTVDDTISYVSRYNESTWNFLKRISAVTGQWLYFNGRELIFGKPETQESRELVYGDNCFNITLAMQARPVLGGYFDYEAPAHNPIATVANSETDVANSDRGFAFGKAKGIYGEESFTHPAALPADGRLLTIAGKSKANTTAADMYRITGESSVHELRVGMIANLKMVRAGATLSLTPIRITAITHELDATGRYANSFEAISAESNMPPEITFAQPITHAMPAEVIDNKDPMGQGRVQVRFLGWRQDHSIQQTDWIRILTPDAGSSDVVGQNRGYVFIPEPGDQVMIDFEQSNPDRPFVTGSIFHGKNGKGGGIGNNTKSIMTRSGHTFEINDGDNGTHIILRDPSGNEIYLDTQGRNITITTPETMTLISKNMKIQVEENMDIQVGKNITERAGENKAQSVGKNKRVTVGKNYDLTATDIREEALESFTSESTTSEHTAAQELSINSLEGSIKKHAEQEIRNNSGSKGLLF